MSYPAIEAKSVCFSYGKNEILHGVDFAAQKGQLIAVLGPNGAGKSTLFRCLLGLYHSYQGSITIEGREVKNMQPREIAAKVAYIPQTHTPTFHYTVLEMVLMGTTHRVRGLQSPGEKELAIARGARGHSRHGEPQLRQTFRRRAAAGADCPGTSPTD